MEKFSISPALAHGKNLQVNRTVRPISPVLAHGKNLQIVQRELYVHENCTSTRRGSTDLDGPRRTSTDGPTTNEKLNTPKKLKEQKAKKKYIIKNILRGFSELLNSASTSPASAPLRHPQARQHPQYSRNRWPTPTNSSPGIFAFFAN